MINSAERLGKSQQEGTTKPNDFHIELLKLRQLWRLKKVGNTILGDLSYKTGNSFLNQNYFILCRLIPMYSLNTDPILISEIISHTLYWKI